METRLIACGCPGCRKSATYKLAARWSDGRFSELKTYALSCLDHFGLLYREALLHRAAYPPAPGELLGEVGIYRCGKGTSSEPVTQLRVLEERFKLLDRSKPSRSRVRCG